MCAPPWPITILLFRLFGTATSSPVSIHTNAPPLPSQILPPSPFPTVLPSPPAPSVSVTAPNPPLAGYPGAGTGKALCPLTMTPSALVVRFGDPVMANCSVSTVGFPPLGWVGLSEPLFSTMERYVVWRVDSMTEWSIKPTCYALSEQGGQCDINLSLTVYKPPDNVSISLVNHTGPLLEGGRYTLQCIVQDVAPVENLTVTFYKGEAVQSRLQPNDNNNTVKTPVTEIFTLDINPSKEDDGAQYWCDARLELGPEGPQPPPVVTSQKLQTRVVFGPELKCPTKLKVREGEILKCEVAGHPLPSVTWLRDGQVVALPAHSNRNHAGKYTIWTKGFFGQKNFTVEVEVLGNRGAANICTGHFLMVVFLLQMMFWL